MTDTTDNSPNNSSDNSPADAPANRIFYALPVRDVVIFPRTTTTVLVGRKKSVKAIEGAKKTGAPIFVVTQTDPDQDIFDQNNIYPVGTLCNIVESITTTDGTLKLIIQGIDRAEVIKIIPSEDFFSCEIKILRDIDYDHDNDELQGLIRGCVKSFSQFAEYDKRITQDIINTISKVKSPFDLAHMVVPFLNCPTKDKQTVLSENEGIKKLYKVFELLQLELNILQAEVKISKRVQERISKSQKDLYLSEQLKYIKKELGQDEDGEIKELKSKIAQLKLPKEVAEKCKSEMDKLEKTNLFSSEAGVIRNYLDWIIQLPWSNKTTSNNNLDKAKKILDKNHYALKKIKDRILEFIAVQIKTKELKGPILCLVGAPGVGKTSLAKSIADSLNRKYVKVSLGGVRDESEIRGHRRTYIGSLPGRIIQSMKKAKVINPLILLDEIDKMSYDMRGDPSAALLEVLDPEQNSHFSDHYLEVDYDLSKVMFVATANNIAGIPAPLRDRMEIIRLSGYTESEKLQIAKKHLVPKQKKENGLDNDELKISDEALRALIRKYTFEAGVRNLNREIANIARKGVREILAKKISKLEITEKNLAQYSGVEKFHYGIAKETNQIGIATGLAYTDFGGDLLDIEAIKFHGSGKIQTTGKLGDVMKESAQTALSYVRSIAKDLKISEKEFNKYDFHIHVPEGATPKDGPSAGVALCLALFSCIADLPVNKDIAVTGEVTLTGRVLEIGGLKEKLLAALRGGIKTVLVPKANEKDLEELPDEVRQNLNIIFVSNVKEAFVEALIGYQAIDKTVKKIAKKTQKLKKARNSLSNEINPLS